MQKCRGFILANEALFYMYVIFWVSKAGKPFKKQTLI